MGGTQSGGRNGICREERDLTGETESREKKKHNLRGESQSRERSTLCGEERNLRGEA
jgi:hypothetical protein